MRCFCMAAVYFRPRLSLYLFVFFFFNDTATTEIYTLSLHDALPILEQEWWTGDPAAAYREGAAARNVASGGHDGFRGSSSISPVLGTGCTDSATVNSSCSSASITASSGTPRSTSVTLATMAAATSSETPPSITM